ncbi:MAG: hypothetical protein LBU58_03390 [Clostridiales bacterium]|jgi:hypothetical protein|nr:hypothetical protein [Clostridiales bacterium]
MAETLRDFINIQLKAKNLLFDNILSELDIGSKSKFYRYLKEPFRFTDDQLDRLALILSLEQDEKAYMFSFKATSSDAISSLSDEIEHEMMEILLADSESFTVKNSCDYEFYDYKSKTTFVLALPEFVEHLSNSIFCEDGPEKAECLISATIYNSTSPREMQAITEVVYSLSQKLGGRLRSIKLMHYINSGQDDILPKFRILRANLPITTRIPNYDMDNRSLDGHVWASNTNYFILKCGLRAPATGVVAWSYVIVNLENPMRAYAYSTDNISLFSFFSMGIDERNASAEAPSNITFYLDEFLRLSKHFPKLQVHTGLCFDNILPEIWERMLARVTDERQVVEVAKMLQPISNGYVEDARQLVQLAIDSISARFSINESSQAYNLLTAAGLKRFAEERLIAEAGKFGMTMTKDDVIAQLEYLRAGIGSAGPSGHQRYFLIKPIIRHPLYTLVCFRGAAICVSPSSVHVKSPLSVGSIIRDKSIGNAFYNFVTNDLLGNRETHGSFIMTDEDARDFITKLIREVSESA